jgi:hypothetical protein
LTFDLGRSRTVPHMSGPTTDPTDGFGLVGVGIAACVACCAPLIVGVLGGLGLAGVAATFVIGGVSLVITIAAVLAYVLFRRRTAARDGESCAADGSGVADDATRPLP